METYRTGRLGIIGDCVMTCDIALVPQLRQFYRGDDLQNQEGIWGHGGVLDDGSCAAGVVGNIEQPKEQWQKRAKISHQGPTLTRDFLSLSVHIHH